MIQRKKTVVDTNAKGNRWDLHTDNDRIGAMGVSRVVVTRPAIKINSRMIEILGG